MRFESKSRRCCRKVYLVLPSWIERLGIASEPFNERGDTARTRLDVPISKSRVMASHAEGDQLAESPIRLRRHLRARR